MPIKPDRRCAIEVPSWTGIALPKGKNIAHRTARMFIGQVPMRKAVVYFSGRAYLIKERLGRAWFMVKHLPELDEDGRG